MLMNRHFLNKCHFFSEKLKNRMVVTFVFRSPQFYLM
nr:MAG TPA: hypothetical protein [Microviridae sp.]